MKQTFYPLLLISITGIIFLTSLPSCRKDKFQLNIKQFDSLQIQNYMAANGLTGFQKDTAGGDTSGIYYKIISPGSGNPLQYSDSVRFVYTERTFDGAFVQADTIANHYSNYVGHLKVLGFPLGLQTAVHNLLMYPNATIRALVPSHLAYGRNGTGTGSTKVTNNRINGNQCIDYYLRAINNIPVYDDLVIQNYMKTNNLSGYTRVQSTSRPGNYYYYKILISSSKPSPITVNSAITATYTGQLFNGSIFDGSHNGANTLTTAISGFIPGVLDGLTNYAVAGTEISLLLPSALGYGLPGNSGIPPFSCLRFTWNIISVTP